MAARSWRFDQTRRRNLECLSQQGDGFIARIRPLLQPTNGISSEASAFCQRSLRKASLPAQARQAWNWYPFYIAPHAHTQPPY